MENEKIITFSNTYPNGTKADIFYLTLDPYESGDYLIEFQKIDFLSKENIGRLSLVDGEVIFNETFTGVTYTGLKLLAEWIENHVESK